jgi:hypothetical protein
VKTEDKLKETEQSKTIQKLAETEGFEPSKPISGLAHLANECLQPLGHVSMEVFLRSRTGKVKREWEIYALLTLFGT